MDRTAGENEEDGLDIARKTPSEKEEKITLLPFKMS